MKRFIRIRKDVLEKAAYTSYDVVDKAIEDAKTTTVITGVEFYVFKLVGSTRRLSEFLDADKQK